MRPSILLLVIGLSTISSAAAPPKICVADLANSSMQPVFTDRIKQAIVDALQEGPTNVQSAFTATMLADHLALSANNKTVFKREKCQFMLLAEVQKTNSQAAQNAAAEPTKDLTITFALFKGHKSPAPVLQKQLPMSEAQDTTATGKQIATLVIEFLRDH